MSDETMPVDRCVCHDITFAELRRVHERTGEGLEQLGRRTGCGKSCGLCLPYIRAMLATGRVRFAVIRTPER